MNTMEAQTARLMRKNEVVDALTTRAKPYQSATRASDGSPLEVRANKARTDVLIEGTDKHGVPRSLRYVVRARGKGALREFGCSATYAERGRKVGRLLVTASPGERTCGFGVEVDGRVLSLTFTLAAGGQIAVRGTQRGAKLPANVEDTIDPARPGASHVREWVSAVTGSDLSGIDYFAPLATHVAGRYEKQGAKSMPNINLNNLAALVHWWQSHPR